MRAQISKVKENIVEIRQMLDEIMYCGRPIADKDFKHLRSAYDKVCEANDELCKL